MTSINLCFDAYIQNLSSGLRSMLNTSCFFDVTLAADGKLFNAHRVILAMCSPYFEELFKANACQNNHINVCIVNVKHEIIGALLAYMYEGNVEIQVEDFDLFITTANNLKIKGFENSNMNSGITAREEAEDNAFPILTVKDEELFTAEADRHNLIRTFEASDNMSIKLDDASMDIGHPVIQYPNDDEDDDNDIECEDKGVPATCNNSHLNEDSRGEDHISMNKSGISYENIPKSSSSYHYEETVTVSFLKKDLHETCSSILVNDVCFSFVRNNKWKCTYGKHCQASIDLTDDKHIVFHGEHNHTVEKSLHLSAIVSQETYIVRSLAKRRSRRRKEASISNVKTSMNATLANGDSVTVSFIKSLKREGCREIIINGMRYSKQYEYKLKLGSRWQCRMPKCNAYVILMKYQRIFFGNQHCHARGNKCSVAAYSKRTYSVVLHKYWDNMKSKLTPIEARFTDGESVSVSFIKSSRTEGCGGIIVNGLRYSRTKNKLKRWTRWVCSGRTVYNCKAYIVLTMDQRIVFGEQHNHGPLRKYSAVTDSQRMYSVLCSSGLSKKLERSATTDCLPSTPVDECTEARSDNAPSDADPDDLPYT